MSIKETRDEAGRVAAQAIEKAASEEENKAIARYMNQFALMLKRGMAPIQAKHFPHNTPQTFVPYWLAEIAYKQYSALYGGSQSLERLCERGGFCPVELAEFLSGGSFKGDEKRFDHWKMQSPADKRV